MVCAEDLGLSRIWAWKSMVFPWEFMDDGRNTRFLVILWIVWMSFLISATVMHLLKYRIASIFEGRCVSSDWLKIHCSSSTRNQIGCSKSRLLCQAVAMKSFHFQSHPKWRMWRFWPRSLLVKGFWGWSVTAMSWIPKNHCRLRWKAETTLVLLHFKQGSNQLE